MTVGGSTAARATLTWDDGATEDITQEASWSTNGDATLSHGQCTTGTTAGQQTLTASVTARPAVLPLSVGDVGQLQLSGTFSDGQVAVFSPVLVPWSGGSPVASVSGDGHVSASTVGTGTVQGLTVFAGQVWTATARVIVSP